MRRALSIVGVSLIAAVGLVVGAPAAPSHAATSLGPDFVDDYTLIDLGAPEGVPLPLGAVTIKADDPDVMLIGGSANTPSGAIYAVPLTRDPVTDEISGFAGPGTFYAGAPNIDGGLVYMPGTQTLLYTAYPSNRLGQILPGQTEPAQIDDLTSTGIPSSVGSLVFTPASFTDAGALRIMSFATGGFYTLSYSADGDGTYTLGAVATPGPAVPSGAEGAAYVPAGSAGFPAPSILVANYSQGAVTAYEVDGAGVPMLSSARPFLSELTGAVGSHIDVLSGDFLFSSFSGGNNVTLVRGFNSAEVAPMIETESVPAATVGTAYSAAITVTGDPLPTVAVSGGTLPPGLDFDPITRSITGVPDEEGTFAFTLTATNVAGVDDQEYRITVAAAAVAPVITTETLPDGAVGTAYGATIAATGAPAPVFAVIAGELPAGLTLNAATGAVTGTPAEAGTFSWQIEAVNAAGRDVRAFDITIAAVAVSSPSPVATAPVLASSGMASGSVIMWSMFSAVVGVAGVVLLIVSRRRRMR